MKRPSIFLIVPILLSKFISISPPLEAQILLKPNGQNAAPVRLKSLRADVRIVGPFAETTLDLGFQNELGDRVEADFIYTLPNGAVVTYFAYYYGEEKVVARVAEKERAAEIYRHITTRLRDPALVEMIGKNTFRARIFPVMPHADLRVEIHLVQALPSDKGEMSYVLPLLNGAPEEKNTLDTIDVTARVYPDVEHTRYLLNNLGLPLEKEDGVYTLKLTGSNYRPLKDLRLTWGIQSIPLVPVVYAARSGGSDGFFALLLVPRESVAQPSVQIRGVSTYDVTPPTLTGGKGRALLVTGRHRGSGKATIVLKGKGHYGPVVATEDVEFTDRVEPNHLGVKLWAAERIHQLSINPKNRNTIIALSKQYTLPSKWTSWIAIPQAEKDRYEREKTEADFDAEVQRLAELIGEGKGRSKPARQTRLKLRRLSAKTGRSLHEFLRYNLEGRMSTVADQIAQAEREPRLRSRLPGLRRELKQLGIETHASIQPYLSNARRNNIITDIQSIARRIAKAVAEGEAERPAGRRLRNRLSRLEKQVGGEAGGTLRSTLNDQLSSSAYRLVRARRKYGKESKTVLQLVHEVERLSEALKQPEDEALQQAEIQVAFEDQNGAQNQLEKEVREGRIAGERANRHRTEIERLSGIAMRPRKLPPGYSPSTETPESWTRNIIGQAEDRAHQKLSDSYINEIVRGKGDSETGHDLRSKLEEIERFKRRDPNERIRKTLLESHVYRGMVSDLADERARGNPDEARISDLESKLSLLEKAAGLSDRSHREQALQMIEPLYDIPVDEQIARNRLIDELRIPKPDSAQVKRLKDRLQSLTEERRNSRYAGWRVSRLEAEVALDQLEKLPTPTPEEMAKKTDLERRAKELRARMGDPLISVEAPKDAEQVVAIMPTGEIKPLAFDLDSGKWQARFDIPTYAGEGEYSILILIVTKDGVRRSLAIRYHVDVTPPEGRGSALPVAVGEERRLRLEIDADRDTARVSALLPGREPVVLRPAGDPAHPGRFLETILLPNGPIPETVTYILTDKAHNRTAITVEVGE